MAAGFPRVSVPRENKAEAIMPLTTWPQKSETILLPYSISLTDKPDIMQEEATQG